MRGKRIIALLLVLILGITLLPAPVQAAKGGKLVALTFDDGPHRTYTKQLLDGLRQRGVHVTFFMLGSNAGSNSSLVQVAYDDGHEIGNHSYNHPNLNTLGASGVRNEINSTSAVLDKACGSGTKYLVRPPYGNANATVLSAIGSPAINWSVDTNDWQYRDSNRIYNHIINNASDGAIILCHDIYSTTVTGSLRAVDALLARGYEFVTVSELFRRRGVALQEGAKLYNCKNNGIDLGPVEKPVITYEAVVGGVRVTIHSPSGAPVYYNLDGSRFNQESTLYTGSFIVQCPVQIRAVAAFKMNGGRSEVATCSPVILSCAAPEIKAENDLLTLSCNTKGVPIYYSLDGVMASDTYNQYVRPMTINPGTTIRAIAGGGSHSISSEVVRHYSKNGNLFSDVFPGDWYYSAIDKMAAMGILQGIGNDAYIPYADTTRAMLVVMLYRYSGDMLEEGWIRTNTFTDVEDGIWYSEAIEWAYRNEMVVGYSDNTFRHSQPITREEMAKIIAKFINYRGYSLDTDTDCRDEFLDGTHIQEWAVESVNMLVATGLMQGGTNGNFMPSKSAARAEVAMVLSRLIEWEEELESDVY